MEHDLSVAMGTLRIHRAYDAYLDRVVEEVRGLPRAAVQSSSPALGDAVVLSGLLDVADKPVEVIDAGSAVGASTFLFASHPSVRRVVSVTTNSMVAEKIDDDQHAGLDLPPTDNVRAQDLVGRILDDFPEYSAKVEFFDGVLSAVASKGAAPKPVTARFDPAMLAVEDGDLIALIDGRHTSDGVFDDLEALLQTRPDALVLLNNCRHQWGPFVQGGVARLLQTHRDRFAFQLLADLSPGLGGSNLGIVYSSNSCQWVDELVAQLVGSLSMRLDPLTLLARQQTLLESHPEVRSLRVALERTRQSTSWRLTAPIRDIGGRLSRWR